MRDVVIRLCDVGTLEQYIKQFNVHGILSLVGPCGVQPKTSIIEPAIFSFDNYRLFELSSYKTLKGNILSPKQHTFS